MKNKEYSACILMIVSMVMLFSIMFFNIVIFLNNVLWLNIALYSIIGLLIVLSVIGYVFNKNVYLKLSLVASIVLVIIYLVYFVLVKTDTMEKITSFEDLRQLILSFGGWGIFTYIVINLLQCVVIPVPTTLTVLVGTAIYGPFIAFLYATIGVILGSSIAFLIGRYCSRPVINWIFGKSKVEKYQNILNKRAELILFLTLTLPFFPDDLICMMAGVSDIKYYKFLLISIFARGVGLATISFFGSGKIIPFSGWGITVWAVIAIVVIAILVVAIKKRDKIKQLLRIDVKKQ
ncbi:MAG: TVP38/TMEM64 family protein [Clostridia bacterium]|nr:TVP38/TMEM64 family protein [Clostridia bacterium]